MNERIEKVKREIVKAYAVYTAQHDTPGGYMPLRELGDRIDATIPEIHQALMELKTADVAGARRMELAPESNQKILTGEDRACRMSYGNRLHDLVAWHES